MADGVYIGHTSGLYLSDTESIATNGAHGITKTRPARSFPTADAGRYYFEPAEGDTNQYYLFCLKEGQKYYIENRSAEHIYLTENAENKTAFIVTDESNSRFSLQSTVTLTIKNRPFILKAIKMDGDSGQPLQGVSFALHKQRTVDGITQFDPNPMDGYETLVTDEQGIIPGIDNTLPSGTYQLRENQAKQSYVLLSGYIHFTIGDTGRITLGTVPDGVTLSSEDSSSDETVECVIHIPNHQEAEIVLKKEDDKGNALTGAKFQLCKFTTNWETVEAYREIDLTDASQTTLSGLKLGRYRLTETMAPDGYLIINRFVFFTITSDESGVLQITLTDEEGTGENSNPNASATDLTISVRNMPGVELPKSGGPGTALYTAAGGILLCLGAWLLLRRRKKENV